MADATAIILEDDPFWMAEIGRMLGELGVTVVEATTVDQALRLQLQQPAACFVVDIILPDRDGIEFIKAAKDVNPDVRVLAVSGGGRLGSEFYLRLADAFGAVETLQKPLSALQLSQAWARLQEAPA